MAKAKSRRLKVFQAQFGFYDSVVATPSQTAALQAWGTHQNLFANEQAFIAKDSSAVEAALAHPYTPLRRAVGSNDPFTLQPTTLPTLPGQEKHGAARKSANAKTVKKAAVDRSELDAAERVLRKLETGRAREERKLQAEQEAVVAKVADAKSVYVKAHKAASIAVVSARKAYLKTGGDE